jgi:hypothetical protein
MRLGADLPPNWIVAKAVLFVIAGLLAGGIVLMVDPWWQRLPALVITIWCWCRFYDFCFYALHRYVDPAGAYDGLWALLRSRWR